VFSKPGVGKRADVKAVYLFAVSQYADILILQNFENVRFAEVRGQGTTVFILLDSEGACASRELSKEIPHA
jgi:hypothetical protein